MDLSTDTCCLFYVVLYVVYGDFEEIYWHIENSLYIYDFLHFKLMVPCIVIQC